jgi:hypothetical protein
MNATPNQLDEEKYKTMKIKNSFPPTTNPNQDLTTTPSNQNELKRHYLLLLKEYETLKEEIRLEQEDFIKRISDNNPYTNKNVRFASGLICYVNKLGIAKPFPSIDVFNDTIGKNGCPSDVIQLPFDEDNIPPSFFILKGTNMTSNQSCGYEGESVFVNSKPSIGSPTGELGYIDENSIYHEYPVENTKPTSSFTSFFGMDSIGNNILYQQNKTNNECESLCQSNQECMAYLHNPFTSECYLKNKGVYSSDSQENANLNLYIKQKEPLHYPLGSFPKTNHIEYSLYSNYNKDSTFPQENIYNNINSIKIQKLEQLENQINLLASKIENDNNILSNIKNQIQKHINNNTNTIMKDMQSISSTKIAQNNKELNEMLNQSSLELYQNQYYYTFLSLSALLICLFTLKLSFQSSS